MQPLQHSSPLELRFGSTGAGVFVGCGAGVGIVTPISLHSIPLVGQLASSLSTSLGSLNQASGGVFSAVRSRVRGLGVRGLDMGFGCGVMIGYGYGAGVYLKPTAMQSLAAAAQAAGQRVLAALPQPMQVAVREQQQRSLQAQQQPGQLGGSGGVSWGSGVLQPDHSSLGGGGMLPGGSPAAPTAVQHTASTHHTGPPGYQHQDGGKQAAPGGGADAAEVAELTKLVVKQQNRLGELESQVATLQAAVCKLDATAPGCKK